jgi:hypothetical protein
VQPAAQAQINAKKAAIAPTNGISISASHSLVLVTKL